MQLQRNQNTKFQGGSTENFKANSVDTLQLQIKILIPSIYLLYCIRRQAQFVQVSQNISRITEQPADFICKHVFPSRGTQ